MVIQLYFGSPFDSFSFISIYKQKWKPLCSNYKCLKDSYFNLLFLS